ncbi:MAG: phenylacetate--CoA ligase family protein [Bacteroidetes bacterium]|nr:phenylacetate--CoA ligase family protein [Bacteroidota bacterium]
MYNIQEQSFKKIAKIALTSVPFYKKQKINIDIEKITLSDLNNFPIISKSIIQENYQDFISEQYAEKKLQYKSTSGSSGQPFKVPKFYYSDGLEQCMMYRAWSMNPANTYNFHQPCIVLRSFSPKLNEPLYKVDRILNYWYLSPFDISKKNLSIYIDVFNRSKARLLRGYPSSIYILTLLLRENNIKFPQIKTLFTSSENLLPHYKKTIEEYWQIPLIDWYGQNERTATVQMCEYGNYHNNDEYGIIEIDEKNQIIATSLHNNVMPLIRYATNDIAIPASTKVCSCGRGLSIPFAGIDGRADDLLLKDDDTIIATVNIYNAMEMFQDVKQFKIVQQTDKSISLTLSENKPLTNQTTEAIISELKQRLGNLNVKVNLVPEIERDRKTGKIKSIESHIKL